MATQPQSAFAGLDWLLAHPLPGSPDPAKPLPAPRFVPGVGCFVVDDGQSLHGVAMNCLPAWTIEMRSKLNGWAICQNNLYVQDGPVICQYNLSALLQTQPSSGPPQPDNAFNLAKHSRWTGQKPGQLSFHSWYPQQAPDDGYGAPAVWAGNPDEIRIFTQTRQGLIIPMPADLYELDGKQVSAISAYPPDLPLQLAVAAAGDRAILQYLSQGHIVLLERPKGELQYQFKMKLPAPPQWRELAHTAAARESLQQTVALGAPGAAEPVWGSAFTGPQPCQVYVRGTKVAMAAGPGPCFGGDIAAGKNPRAFCAPPVVMPNWGATYLFAITRDLSGRTQFEQCLLATPVAAAGATARNAAPLLLSQLGGIAEWLNSGMAGASPLDEDARAICAHAAGEALGLRHDAAGQVDAQMAARGARASNGMIAVSRSSNSADGVVSALRDLCALPVAAAADGLIAIGYDAMRLSTTLKSVYSSPGPELGAVLHAKGFDHATVAAAMHANGYSVCDFLKGDIPESIDNPEWWLVASRPIHIPVPPSPAAATMAKAIRAAGYMPEEVVDSLRTFTRFPKVFTPVVPATVILRLGWPEMNGESVGFLLASAGYDQTYVVIIIKAIYDVPPGPIPHIKIF